MKKKGLVSTVAYLGISLCLCAGIVAYTGQSSQDTQVAKADIEDVVEGPGYVEIGEEEVPLGTPQVTTKTTSKTTTKKVKMAKAAKKTATTKTNSTKKSSKTSNTSNQKIVEETTVLTTVATSTKKGSKVKTIKTTVRTTVKTTTTPLGTSTSTNNASVASESSSFSINSFSDMKGKVDDKVYQAFVNLGFEYKCDPSISTSGVFSVGDHWIKLKTNNGCYMLHELGHFVAALEKSADGTNEWKNIYNAEKSKYTASNRNYVTATAAEYFAESFRDYSATPGQLKSQRPRTYTYINTVVNNINVDQDCAWFEGSYGMFW